MRFHEPVMVQEVLERLEITPGKTVCDGTLGSAGHGVRIVQAMQGAGTFVGLDRDPAMIERAGERFREEVDERGRKDLRLVLRTARYGDLPEILAEEGLKGADAVLLDIGMNSLQIEDPARGFSFSQEGPLDGRYNPDEPGVRTIAELVNESDENQLAQWMRELSDERFARQIARRIVETRKRAPLSTTTELASIATSCYPPGKRHEKPHPATRTFQALRIVANDELKHVENGVRACIESLNPGGAICVISYHSGEDRIVKRLFDEYGSPKEDPNNRYSATTTEGLDYRVEKRGAEKPADEETDANPRARSARLRTLRRLGGAA